MGSDKELLPLDTFSRKQKLKDIPICEMAKVIRKKSKGKGVLVMIDHGDEGTQMGCSGLTREQALLLVKYWSNKLIKELDREK
jgi:hypothetical protein